MVLFFFFVICRYHRLAVEQWGHLLHYLLISWKVWELSASCFISWLHRLHFCVRLFHNRFHCRRTFFDYTLSWARACWIATWSWELRMMPVLQCIFVTLHLRSGDDCKSCWVHCRRRAHTVLLPFLFWLFDNVQKHVYTHTGSHFVNDNVNASPPLGPIAWSLTLARAYLSNVCTTSVHLKLCRYCTLLLVLLKYHRK